MAADDWAFVVGLRLYPDLGNLDGPENDARAFHDWVTSVDGGNVPGTQARCILSSQYPAFTSWQRAKPVRDDIEAFFIELDELAKQSSLRGDGFRVGNRLYLYFAGHGLCPKKFIGEEESDDAALFMANAAQGREGLHVAGKAWADRLYMSGFFDEVLLFMDCCRDDYQQVPLNPPIIRQRRRPSGNGADKRFYAFATKWRRKSWERQMDFDGKVHGVFTQTLLAGLKEGGSNKEHGGDITAASLKSYLLNNFKSFLAPSDVGNPEVDQEPDVVIKDEFVIVSRPLVKFPITIHLSPAMIGQRVAILDGKNALQQVDAKTATDTTWTVPLARGTYLIQIDAGASVKMVEVQGTGPQDVTV